MKSSILLSLVTLALTLGGAFAAEIEWTRYNNPTFGYSIDAPLGLFRSSSIEEKGVTLVEQDGRGQIDIYGATNVQMLQPHQFEDVLASADRIREITYSRRGASWFVISGYYQRQGDESVNLIFYAKFMFSPDRRALSAFEASYPVADKRRYDPIIERMEDSLTPPGADTRVK